MLARKKAEQNPDVLTPEQKNLVRKEIDDKIVREQNDLNNVRSSLGMPESDESTASVQALQAKKVELERIDTELNESEKEELAELTTRIQEAESIIQSHSELTEEFRSTGKSADPEYTQKREKSAEEMTKLTKELMDRFGVSSKYMHIPESEVFMRGRETVLLKKAITIAKEAQGLEFNKDLGHAEKVQEAKRLLEDYQEFTEPVRLTGRSNVPDYSNRAEAKKLLIEALAKDLIVELGLGDDIDKDAVRELSTITGVDFSKGVREVVRVIRPRENPEKQERPPQMGVNGTWETSGGPVSGKVVAGRPGGPYVIETPQGKVQVNKIF